MRKIKNLVIGGIENKIFNLVLLTVILVAAVYSVVIVYQTNNLRDLVEKTNKEQKDSITEISDNTMYQVVANNLVTDTRLKATIADDRFREAKSNVLMLGEYAAHLFDEPESVKPQKVSRPDASKDGQVTVQLMSEDGVTLTDPDLSARIGLIANMSDMLEAIFKNTDLSSSFVGLPEGVFLIADDREADKFDENGKLKSIPVTQRPWYTGAVETGGLYFTDVEEDAFTGDIGIVCSLPVYHDGKLVAVVGADLFLDDLKDAVDLSDQYGGFECVINQDGHVLFSPVSEGSFQVHVSRESVDLRQSENKELAAFVGDSLQQSTDITEIEADGTKYYMAGAPLPTVGWTLISAVSKEIAMSPTAMMEEKYDSILNNAVSSYNHENRQGLTTLIVLVIAVLFISIMFALILSKRIVKPLNTISKNIERLSVTKEQFRMEDVYRTGDEIEVLAKKFASLSSRANHYVNQIQKVTAEKERIKLELGMANAIQASQLPHLFPAFPERKEFDIYASMTPAKEVGGDFYDFFLVDDDHIALVMADVAGKGIPAALFMMISKILIRNRVQNGERPGEALRNVNNQLMEGNEAELFVTVWLAIVEISTGKGVEVNAGHEHPVLRRSEGEFELIKYRHSLAVAAMENAPFREREFMLYPGDTVFVYTDGVAEAANEKNELYGTERMLSILNQRPDAEPEEVLRHVMQGINTFVDGAEQFDDITMLCFKYIGPVQEDGATDIVDRDADASAADDNEKNRQESKEREGTDQESETRESKDRESEVRESEDGEGTVLKNEVRDSKAQDSESV